MVPHRSLGAWTTVGIMFPEQTLLLEAPPSIPQDSNHAWKVPPVFYSQVKTAYLSRR
jgi:hypothetical protein